MVLEFFLCDPLRPQWLNVFIFVSHVAILFLEGRNVTKTAPRTETFVALRGYIC